MNVISFIINFFLNVYNFYFEIKLFIRDKITIFIYKIKLVFKIIFIMLFLNENNNLFFYNNRKSFVKRKKLIFKKIENCLEKNKNNHLNLMIEDFKNEIENTNYKKNFDYVKINLSF